MKTKQINLLPDIKQERIKQQRKEQFTRLASIVVIGAMLGVTLIVTGSTYLYQRGKLINTQSDIEDTRAAIAAIENQDELIGMQTAFEELPGLSRERLLVSQLPEVMESVVPDRVALTFFDYESGGNMEIVAESRTYRDLYSFVDSLENMQGTIVGPDGEEVSTEFFTSVEFVASSHGEEITFSIEGRLDDSFLSPADDLNGGNDED